MRKQISDHSHNLYALLGVGPEAAQETLDTAYMRIRQSTPDRQALRIAWKVLRDPLYRSTYDYYGSLQAVRGAGFVDDGVEPEHLHHEQITAPWLTTPIHKLIHQLQLLPEPARRQPVAILLSTGGFSPIHAGHIEIMEIAKRELEARGVPVIGGYFSPTHDVYVSTKPGSLPAEHRLFLCEQAAASSEWLMTDPWEARYVATFINFTDVYSRLRTYLQAHLPAHTQFQLYYVCGGDNDQFARAFIKEGACICLDRPGEPGRLSPQQRAVLTDQNPEIIFRSIKRLEVSSSDIRNGCQLDKMNPDVAKQYTAWNSPQPAPAKRIFELRNEGEWSVEPWLQDSRRTMLTTQKSLFDTRLKTALEQSFAAATPPDQPHTIDIREYKLADQVQYFNKISRHSQPLINLDVCTEGTYKLNLSRLFNLSSSQPNSGKLVARPGCADIATQVAAIPPGKYYLIDDDIASGRTIALVRRLLHPKIEIHKILTLMEYSRRQFPPFDLKNELIDIADCRDFLVGSRESGLVMNLPSGELIRAPYLLPYVSPTFRSSIPPSTQLEFSRRIWELNEIFFRNIQPAIVLSEADPYCRKLLEYVGFRPEQRMEEICAWHVQHLTTLPYTPAPLSDSFRLARRRVIGYTSKHEQKQKSTN